MSRIFRPNAPVCSSKLGQGVEALPRSGPRRAAPACRETALPRSFANSSRTGGSISSIRLTRMASASSSCFLKMYAAFGLKPPAAWFFRIRIPWLGLKSTAYGATSKRPRVEVLQRLNHGRDEIGATADRLGEDHVRLLRVLERADARRPDRRSGSRSTRRALPRRSSPWPRNVFVSTRSCA